MKPALVRSTVFNLLFYALTAIACVLCLPTLVLPRRYFMGVVHFFVHKVHFLEKHILGLRYEVRGLEHLPKDGSYIVAAKHQSAYETLKLHILFKDPSVILKKQLLSIPLWGMYLKKSDPIAIDRSTPEAAIESIQEGARRMKELGRPIIIFPQGTRVRTDETSKNRPYKVGVARIQEATDLPIIPMALNAGLFWPKNSWFKTPGTVIFEFLPPIEPGLERSKLLAELEKETEGAAKSLMNEAKEKSLDKNTSLKSIGLSAIVILLLLFGFYSFVWFAAADHIKKEYVLALQDITESSEQVQEPLINGYPGKLNLFVPEEIIVTDSGNVKVQNLRVKAWPLPGLPAKVTTGTLEVKNFKWLTPLHFDSLYALLKYDRNILSIQESALVQDDFTASVSGTADLKQEPFPALDLNIRLENHPSLLQALAVNGIIETRMALFMGAGLSSLANEDGIVELPLHQKAQTLYAGPLPVMKLPSPADKPLRREPPKIPSDLSATPEAQPDLDTQPLPAP